MEIRNILGSKNPDGSPQLHYGPRLAIITRCDLGQMVELNLDASEYTSTAYPPKPLTAEQVKARGLEIPVHSASDPPTLRIERNTLDTGERKQMFANSARHIITTQRQIPLAGSHLQPQETVTDGWYIDFDERLSCSPHGSKNTRGFLGGVTGPQAREKIDFVSTGTGLPGFPLQNDIDFESHPHSRRRHQEGIRDPVRLCGDGVRRRGRWILRCSRSVPDSSV